MCFSKIHNYFYSFFLLFQMGPETIYQPAHWLRAKMFLTLGPILTKSHHQIKSKILLNFEKSLKKSQNTKQNQKKFHHYHHIILSMCYLHEAFFIQMLIKNWYLLMPQLKEKISSQWKEIWSPPLSCPSIFRRPPKISPPP